MRGKMSAIGTTVFASILLLTACAPAVDQATESPGVIATQIIPDGQEIIPDGAVDMEYVMARDSALSTISERYGEQAPRSGLGPGPWRTSRRMAETLCYNLPQNRLHPAFNALDVELACRSEGARSKDEEGFRLSIANSM